MPRFRVRFRVEGEVEGEEMVQLYKVQIVEADGGRVCVFPGGGAVEKELVGAIVEAVVKRGVGFFRGEGAVRAAIEAGVHEVLQDVKGSTKLLPK